MNKTRLILLSLLLVVVLANVFSFLPKSTGAKDSKHTRPNLASNDRGVTVEFPEITASNTVQVTLTPFGEFPESMAMVVMTNNFNRDTAHWRKFETVLKDANWVPFVTNLVVDLGPGDGKRDLYFSFKFKGDTKGVFTSEESVLVRADKPLIVITTPIERVTSQPLVQVAGFVNKDAEQIRYSVFDETGRRTAAGEGLVNHRDFDRSNWQFSTNYFTCYDVELSPGTNRFIIECKDTTGLSGSTNFQIVFRTAGDTNPPNFKLDWPEDRANLSGSQLTLRGPGDDPTATIACWITDDVGHTETQGGFCERNGYLWVEDVPLKRAGQHQVTLVASDVAGNSSWTNLIVSNSADRLEMDPIPDSKQLWENTVDVVTGFSSRTNCQIFVNGVKAELKPDGHWTAKDVPVKSANGGTATFHVRAEPDEKTSEANTWIPAVHGAPWESLKPAMSVLQVDTNEYDHCTVSLGLTNFAAEDIRGKWILPPEEARFRLRLYDAANKRVISPTPVMKKRYGKPLRADLNIRHLQKKDYEQIGGGIDFIKNSAVRIAMLNLDEFMQMPPAGVYRLEVVPRLFQISGDGKLVPTDFPAISTTLQIRDQESEFVFFLKKLQQQGKLVWSTTTNSLSIGLTSRKTSKSAGALTEIEVFVYNSSPRGSNYTRLTLPPQNEAFRVELYDAAGKQVPKTGLGKQTGQPLSQKVGRSRGWRDVISTLFGLRSVRSQRNRFVPVPPKEAMQCSHFKLQDYFQISRPGKYRLFYEQRFYVGSPNSQIPITMPAVNLPVEIQSAP